MNVLDLFTGYAGNDMGIKLALAAISKLCGVTVRTVCYVEREAYAAANLVAKIKQKVLDDAPIWDDVITFDPKPFIGLVDCVSASLPCQPFSVAGKRKGLLDERWLWNDTFRIVCDLLPGIVWMENVTQFSKEANKIVTANLSEIGYDSVWGCLQVTDVGGTQKRERFFLLGFPKSLKWSNERPIDKTIQPVRLETTDTIVEHAEQLSGRSREWGWDREIWWEQITTTGEKLDDSNHPFRRSNESKLSRATRNTSCFAFSPDDDRWKDIDPSIKPAIYGVADGNTTRVDECRLCGNGVVPGVVALAFIELTKRAGITFTEGVENE